MSASISNWLVTTNKRANVFYFILLFSALGLVTCRKDEIATKEYPRLNTLEVSDITPSGAIFKAQIISGQISDIQEYGFVWDSIGSPDIAWSDKLVMTAALSAGQFSGHAHAALRKDGIYYMRAYLKTSKYLVYGKMVSFQSLGSEAPVIHDFLPKSGTWNDTIKITGKNFRYKLNGMVVKLGNIPVPIILGTDATISVVIPPKKNSQSATLSVEIGGNVAQSASLFTFLNPQISEISPLLATFGDTISIKGLNLLKDTVGNKVWFNGVRAPLIYISKTLLKVRVPDGLKQNLAAIRISGPIEDVEFGSAFQLKQMVLKSFEPDTAFHPKEIITIRGENFNPNSLNDSVIFNGFKATVVEAASGYLKVKLPDEIIPEISISTFTNAGIAVKVGEQSGTFNNNLEVSWKSRWTRKKNFPGDARYWSAGFSIGNKGYFGLGINCDLNFNLSQTFQDLWEYDPLSDTWTRKSDFPGVPRVHESVFVVNNEAYIGLGSNPLADHYPFSFLNDFYKYNPISDQWTRIADFRGIPRYSAASFVSEGLAYVGTGRIDSDNTEPWEFSIMNKEFWNYNPQNDAWNAVQNFPYKTQTAMGITIGNSGYVFDEANLNKYMDNSWQSLVSLPVAYESDHSFTIGSKGYIWSSSLLIFDETTRQTTKIAVPYEVYTTQTTVFAVNNKAYVVCGQHIYPTQIVWEFDPSKP